MKLFWSFWPVLFLLIFSVFNLIAPGHLSDIARTAADFDTKNMPYLTGFYLTNIFLALLCLSTLFYMFRPRKRKGILLYKNKKTSITLDERNIKKIIQAYFRQFPEIKLSKINVKNKKTQVDLNIDLLILPTYNVPQLADRLKEKTLAFLKDLYAKEILNELRFNVMVDDKQLDGMINRGEDLRRFSGDEGEDKFLTEDQLHLDSKEERIEDD